MRDAISGRQRASIEASRGLQRSSRGNQGSSESSVAPVHPLAWKLRNCSKAGRSLVTNPSTAAPDAAPGPCGTSMRTGRRAGSAPTRITWWVKRRSAPSWSSPAPSSLASGRGPSSPEEGRNQGSSEVLMRQLGVIRGTQEAIRGHQRAELTALLAAPHRRPSPPDERTRRPA